MGTGEPSQGLAWLRVLSPPQPLPILAVDHWPHWAQIFQSRAGRKTRATPSYHSSWMGLHAPESTPSRSRSGAHHLEEGCLRVEVVGLLVPQHQIVSCIDDDLLQVDKGAQEPGGTRDGRGTMEKMATDRLSTSPAGRALGRPAHDCPARPFFRIAGKDMDPMGGGEAPPDAIVCHDRLLGGAGDGIVVLEEAQSAPSFRQEGEVRERVLASQSRAAGVSYSQAVQNLCPPAQRERSVSYPDNSRPRPGLSKPRPFFLPRLCLPCLQVLLVHSNPIQQLLKHQRLSLLPQAWKGGEGKSHRKWASRTRSKLL